MPVYTTKKFGVFFLMSCVIGVAVVGLTSWSVDTFFPIFPKVYYQLVDSSPQEGGKLMVHRWAEINHTIVISGDNMVESTLTVTAKETPPYQNVTFKIYFDNPRTYAKDDPAPQVLEGNLSRSGWFGEDFHLNQTITIHTKLRFNFDAKYFVGGQVFSSSSSGSEGYGTVYFLTVEQGKIVKVTDELGQVPYSAEMEAIELSQKDNS